MVDLRILPMSSRMAEDLRVQTCQLPIEYRPLVRRLVRNAYAAGYDDAYLQGQLDAHQDDIALEQELKRRDEREAEREQELIAAYEFAKRELKDDLLPQIEALFDLAEQAYVRHTDTIATARVYELTREVLDQVRKPAATE